jgi:hypothetical protein
VRSSGEEGKFWKNTSEAAGWGEGDNGGVVLKDDPGVKGGDGDKRIRGRIIRGLPLPSSSLKSDMNVILGDCGRDDDRECGRE